MQTGAPEREELTCQTDDDCTNLPDRTGDSKLHDLSELLCDLGGS
jgi:hypothetical protein